jgi:hypothetical protein
MYVLSSQITCERIISREMIAITVPVVLNQVFTLDSIFARVRAVPG